MIEITTADEIAQAHTAMEIGEEIDRRIADEGATALDPEIAVLMKAYQRAPRLGI